MPSTAKNFSPWYWMELTPTGSQLLLSGLKRDQPAETQLAWLSHLQAQWWPILDLHSLWWKVCVYASNIKQNNHWLTHWGRVTHICVSKLTIIGSDNGLSPRRRQAIIWTNAGILLIRILGTNFSEILGKIHSFSFKKMYLKMSSLVSASMN